MKTADSVARAASVLLRNQSVNPLRAVLRMYVIKALTTMNMNRDAIIAASPFSGIIASISGEK